MWSTLKKFGLQYCDLPTMLWNVSVLLRTLTLNIDSRNVKPISLFAYIFWFVIAMAYFYVYLVSMLWFVFIRCRETGDLLAALVVFSLGVSSEIGTVKLVIVYLNIYKIRNIVVDTLACHASMTPGSRFSNNLLVTLRDVKKRAMIFWIVIVGNGVVYILKPILLPGRHLMEDKFILYGLEPIFESPNYQIAFMLLTGSNIFTVYLAANISALLIVVSGYVESQMLALTEEMLHLWEDAEKHYQKTKSDSGILSEKESAACKNKIINAYIEEQLKDVIKIHGRNIGLLSQVEEVFKDAVGLEFVILGMGLIAELLGGLENTYILVPFAMMQVGMDCFTGQRVMDARLEPMHDTPNYQIAFLLMTAGVIFTCYLPANISALLIVIAGYIEAQMLALNEELLHLWEDAEEHYLTTESNIGGNEPQELNKKKIINKYIKSRLKAIIIIHSRTIGLLYQVEEVFQVAIGLEFVLLGIALIAELLGGLENTYIEVPFAMMQVGMDCFTGQRVIDASIKFEKAVYDCKWENYDISNMKTVQTILQSSQKTMKLSAGGIIMLNFSCLMLVNRSIYSAYTTLRTTMK